MRSGNGAPLRAGGWRYRLAELHCYPFEVQIAGTPLAFVLADPIKRVDWRSRKALAKGAVSSEELADVRARILTLVG